MPASPDQPLPPVATPSSVVEARSGSAQTALAFLLGLAVAGLGVQYWHGRTARPLASSSPFQIDLNNASRSELVQLPRVGPGVADQLIAARPFASVDDLQRVGFGAESLTSVRPHVMVGSPAGPGRAPGRVNPNTATLEELQELPGIGPKLAQRIVEARAARLFTAADDLRRVPGIGPKTLQKLRDWLVFKDSGPTP